jgi:hypothetical protein
VSASAKKRQERGLRYQPTKSPQLSAGRRPPLWTPQKEAHLLLGIVEFFFGLRSEQLVLAVTQALACV